MACVNISVRLIIFLMLCLVSMITNIVRGHMSIVILAMAKPISNTSLDAPDYGPRYEWSAYEQSLIIGSLFWGQVISIMFVGVLAERHGARSITGFGLTIAAILFVLAPVSANYLWLLIIVNFFIGITTGTIAPAIQALISRWAPPEEKGKFQSSLMANGFGIVINWTTSGLIIKNCGWHYAFYAVGIIIGLYSIAWFCIVHDSPNNHPKITDAEKEFILSKLKTTSTKTKKPWPPFRAILLSIPFWALVVYHFGNLYATFLFMTAAPKYLSEVHHFDISTTGFLSSIPYLIRFPFAIVFGILGDFVVKRKIMNNTGIRKGFSVFSHFIPACCLISLTFTGTSPYVCIALITLALGSSSSVSITSVQNPHDLSPNFSTTIFGFMHTIGSTTGIIAPLVVAYFTKERNSENEWQYVFLIGAGVLASAAIIFILFGSVQVQKWNKIEEDEEKAAQQFIEIAKIEYSEHVKT